MEVHNTKIPGVKIIVPDIFNDGRGLFYESYSKRSYEKFSICNNWVQDNMSFSKKKGTIRGLHFQYPPHTQTKLIHVLEGTIYDVVVDLRKDSPTYKKWESYILSVEDCLLLVPKGCAHGFCTMEPDTRVSYKNDAFYEPSSEGGVRWDDPDLGIPWPAESPILSDKDKVLPPLSDIRSPF